MFLFQFCGINAIVFYLTDIFLEAGFEVQDGLAGAAAVASTQVFATVVAIFIVDRLGRRVLLLASRCDA